MCSSDLLPPHIVRQASASRSGRPGSPAPSAGARQAADTMDEIERLAMEEALVRCGGNVSEAMRSLKMGRNRFYRKLKKYGLVEMLEQIRDAEAGIRHPIQPAQP